MNVRNGERIVLLSDFVSGTGIYYAKAGIGCII